MRVVNGGMKKLVEGIRKARKAYERLLQKKSEGMKEEGIGARYTVKGIIYQQNRGIKEEWKIKISENFKADKKIISEMIRC